MNKYLQMFNFGSRRAGKRLAIQQEGQMGTPTPSQTIDAKSCQGGGKQDATANGIR